MTFPAILSNAETVVSEAVYATVFVLAFIAYHRTRISAFAYLVLASLLYIILIAGEYLGRISLVWYSFSFNKWVRIGHIVGLLLWGVGFVKLIRYLVREFERKSPPNTALEPTGTAPVSSTKP